MLIIGFLFLLIMILFMFTTNNIEGMTTISKYTYLKPLIADEKWDTGIVRKFVDKYNENFSEQNAQYKLNADTFMADKNTVDIRNNITEEEAKYYIENKKFPYCHYVKDYLDNNPTSIPSNFVIYEIKITPSNVSTILSNRQVYDKFISSPESKLEPQPESYGIFTGTKTPPVDSDSVTSLKNSDYAKLKDICKSVNTA